MNYTVEKIQFSSSNSINIIHGFLYIPQGEIKAIIQISHGMCENISNYKEFAEYFVKLRLFSMWA